MTDQHTPFFERIWFLDCFGHVISHVPSQDRLIRTPFQCVLMNGFVPAPYPVPPQAELSWWTLHGEQLPVQPLIMKRLRKGLVKLQKKNAGEYLSINPRTEELGFVTGVNDWEKFLPVTEAIMRGLSLLCDPDMARISSTGTRQEPHLAFLSPGDNKPGGARIGETIISLYDNLPALESLAGLHASRKKTISLRHYDGKGSSSFHVHCRSDRP